VFKPTAMHHMDIPFPMQVVGAVGFAKQHLALPPELDERVARLIRACWAPQPADRPSFAQILEQLKEFRGELPAAVQAAPAGSGSQRADSGTTGGTAGDVLSLGGGDMAATVGSPPLEPGSDMLPAAAAAAAPEVYDGPLALQTPAPPAAAAAGGGARSYMAPAASLPIPRLPPPPMPGAGGGQAAALGRIAPAASLPVPGALQRSSSSGGGGGTAASGVSGAGAGALQPLSAGSAAGGPGSKARSSGGGGATASGDAGQAGSSLDNGPPTAPLIEI
jgi:hypothetical protein